jgi:hypothetical protein
VNDHNVGAVSPAIIQQRREPVVLFNQYESTNAPHQQFGQFPVPWPQLYHRVTRTCIEQLNQLPTKIMIDKEILTERPFS